MVNVRILKNRKQAKTSAKLTNEKAASDYNNDDYDSKQSTTQT